jgi:transcription initiation factor IIE alpha subunit
MEICTEHDIAYEGKECPACSLQQELNEARKEIEKLEKEIDRLNDLE